ncbi:MAG: alpha-glucuronidase, partial [Bacteroidales bacterium]|nr:alpha-glucuronidase [Bacteroidales bacterium]
MNRRLLFLIIMIAAIAGCSRPSGNGNALWLPEGEPAVNAEVIVDSTLDIRNDGFMIKDGPDGRRIMARTEIGALYGTYALQRLERIGKADGQLDIIEEPSYERRILNHWDNLDNTIERGYAG